MIILSRWDRNYLDLAFYIARSWSKDPSTKVGAVLVGHDKREVALGYNGFPHGIADTCERLHDRPTKYLLTIHAERNVLDNARFDTLGSTLYSTQIPCTQFGCSLSLISKGVRRVVCPRAPDRQPWASDAAHTRALLEEAGVELLEIDGYEVGK